MLTKRLRPILFLAGMMVLLAACNFPGASNQPTIGPEVIYTAAAQTLIAQQTQAAQGTPVIVATSTPGVVVPSSTAVPATNTPVPTNTSVPTATSVPATATATPIPCNRGQYVSDVTVPDNTEIAAGSTFVKTWKLKNNGSCSWTSSYSIVFYSGDKMSGPDSAPIITNGTVPPGETVNVSVTLIAPTTPGTYKGNWRLRDAAGTVFGIGSDADSSFYVSIKSVAPTPTPSPTPAFTLSFDFIARGPDAHWRNATTDLQWVDPPEDSAGVAINIANVKLEDGKTYPSLLAEYPQHIKDGMILGLYPAYTIQTNDHLRTSFGFRANCGESSARFQIHYIDGQSDVVVIDELETCNGKLSSVDVNLEALVGHKVQFELVIIAVGTPDSFSTVWVAPRIER